MLSKRRTITVFAVLLLIAAATWAVRVVRGRHRPVASARDGSVVEYLGNKMADDGHSGRARNVWDLQLYDSKIYLGGGDTTTDAGPINVWSFDPVKRTFEREFIVDEEAIELFHVIDGDLYIPASDPAEGDRHKFYRRRGGAWKQFGGPPDLAHVRGLAHYQGKLVGVGNCRQNETETSAFVSLDEGQTFQAATDPNQLGEFDNRFYSTFEFRGVLFATSMRFRVMRDIASVFTFDNQTNQFTLADGYTTSDFLPITGDSTHAFVTMRPWRPVEFNGALVYPVKTYGMGFHYRQGYTRSYVMFVKADLETPPVPIVFPDGISAGEDLLVRGDMLYALANLRRPNGQHLVFVYRTTDPLDSKAWEEVLRFVCTNKARSFEWYDGTFYFGLGCESDDEVAHAGALLGYKIEGED